MDIEQSRLLTMKAAWLMDTVGNKGAAVEVSAIKVIVPNMALRIIDRAIQAHGAMAVSRRRPAGRDVRRHPDAASRRRAGRGPQDAGRATGVAPLRDLIATPGRRQDEQRRAEHGRDHGRQKDPDLRRLLLTY